MVDRVVFGRIGWMKFYQGSQPGDEKPLGAGTHNDEGVGLEIYNFQIDENGKLYGYAEARGNLSLNRIDKHHGGGDSVENVLFIWVHEKELGVKPKEYVIAGWYNNATVNSKREFRPPSVTRHNEHCEYDQETGDYYATVDYREAVLIPEECRENEEYRIKTGKNGIGQNAIFYPTHKKPEDEAARREWVDVVIEYIEGYSGPNLMNKVKVDEYIQKEDAKNIEDNQIVSGGQGRATDSEMNSAIEEHAMDEAMEYYEKIYSDVRDVSHCRFRGEAYDILCQNVKADRVGEYIPNELRVEVKGTTNSEPLQVYLTKNEVNSAKKYDSALFIVHSIKWDRENKSASGGEMKVLDPWNIHKDGDLVATQFTYTLNE